MTTSLTTVQADAAPAPSASSADGAIPHLVPFGKKFVRVITVEGRQWFVAADVYGIKGRELDREAVAAFVCTQRSRHTVQTADGPKLLHTVTALGALTIAAKLPHGLMVFLWLRKQIALLSTPEGGTAPKASLGMLADGSLPPKPKASTDLLPEWLALAASQRPYSPPRWPVDKKFYAIADDDTAERWDFEADAAQIRDIMQRGEALVAAAAASHT